MYLWTKRGAARHAKMLNTDRAWDVFELLEDNYFNRPAVALVNPLAQVISELAAVEREKLALEREKFNVANSEETKTFAMAQLLRELASASGESYSALKIRLCFQIKKRPQASTYFIAKEKPLC